MHNMLPQAMKLVGQQTVGRDVVRLSIILSVFVVLCNGSIAQPESLDDVYTTRAVATGKADMTSPVKESYPNRW
jgi:hypothetical protein